MRYIIRHMFWDFFRNPVAVHTFWCDDKSEVALTFEEQSAEVIDQYLRLACSHLHKEPICILASSVVHCRPLVIIWFRFEFIVDSHL